MFVAITGMFLGTTVMFLASAVLCQATVLVLGWDTAIVLHVPCTVQGLRRNFRANKVPFSPFLAFGRPFWPGHPPDLRHKHFFNVL